MGETIIRCTMGPKLTEFCDGVGTARQENSVRLGRTPDNNAPTDPETALAMNILGARCEGAAWSWLKPIKWHHEPDGPIHDRPDLQVLTIKIDVKGKRLNKHDLVVQLDAVDNWVYLLVSAEEHPRYNIYGWLYGDEAKTHPVMELKPGRPAHVVKDKALLRPPYTLADMVGEFRRKTRAAYWNAKTGDRDTALRAALDTCEWNNC